MALAYPLLCGCGTTEYPLSDHYDGKKFFNSGGYEEPGFWETVKLLAGLRYKKWPDSAGNKPVLNLDAALGPDQVAVTFTPAQHFSSRGLFDRNTALWGSYLIRSRGRLIYFGGDAGYSAHFREIRDRFGPVELALLPIGAYEPRWFMKAFHMNPAEAVQAHVDLRSRQSIGIHFGTFQLTEEEIDAPPRDLVAALAETNLDPKSFVTLSEGVTTIYSMGR